MPLGEFSIGRSSACNLALADSLVSRRHALFDVTADGVTVQDLGSRNGVSVNGLRIDRVQTLDHLDRVYIGSQELVLIDSERVREASQDTSGYVSCDACGTLNGASKRRCGECGELLASAATRTVAKASPPSEGPGRRQSIPVETKKARALEVIGPIAQKSLALGHYSEAEKILRPHMDTLLQHARQGLRVDENTVRQATEFALAMSDGLTKPAWLDWAFELHAATKQLVDATTVDQLHDLVRRVNYANTVPLRDYLKTISRNEQAFSAAERFVVRRLQGLEKVIAAR